MSVWWVCGVWCVRCGVGVVCGTWWVMCVVCVCVVCGVWWVCVVGGGCVVVCGVWCAVCVVCGVWVVCGVLPGKAKVKRFGIKTKLFRRKLFKRGAVLVLCECKSKAFWEKNKAFWKEVVQRTSCSGDLQKQK